MVTGPGEVNFYCFHVRYSLGVNALNYFEKNDSDIVELISLLMPQYSLSIDSVLHRVIPN